MGLDDLRVQGARLRVEAIVSNATCVSEDNVFHFQVCLLDFFLNMDFFGSMDFADLRLPTDECVNLLRCQDPLTLPRILGAEGFAGFLMDGGGKRLFSRSLSLALGGETLGQRRARAYELNHPIIEPCTDDFSHITSAMVMEKCGILYDGKVWYTV